MTCFRWRILMAPQSVYSLGDRSLARDDERREVVEIVLGELRNPSLDADGRAACAALLTHVALSRQP
jgi:hypothetical protein